MLDHNTVELVATLVQRLWVLDDSLVQLTNLSNEGQALLSVSIFKDAKLVHHFVCVRAHILKYAGLNLELLRHFIHSAFDVFILIVKLIFQDFDLGLGLRYL